MSKTKTQKPKTQKAPSAPSGAALAKQLNLYPTDLPRIHKTITTKHGVKITRAMAIAMLKKNFEGQRGISATKTGRLTAKFKSGAWMDTGQGISQDWYGRLIDGQHRLTAFIDSGLPFFETTVTTGLDPKVFIHLDEDSSARHLKDLLTSGGLPRGGMTAAAFRMLLAYDNLQHKEQSDRGFLAMGHVTHGKWRDNREDALAWCLKHRKVFEHVTERLSSRDAKNILRPMSLFSGFYLWVALENMAQADDFFEKLITGLKISATDAIYHLRRELIDINRRMGEGHTTPYYQTGALLIKAWNAHLAREKMSSLSFTYKEGWPRRKGARRVFAQQEASASSAA